MSPFVEVHVLTHTRGTDPRDEYNASEARVVNLAAVWAITPRGDGRRGTVLHFDHRATPTPFFVVSEPYEALVAILTSWQPRPA